MHNRFRNRSQIAEHLGVSRMTLSRWEKKMPIPDTPSRYHVLGIKKETIDKWYKELIKKYWYLTLYRRKRY